MKVATKNNKNSITKTQINTKRVTNNKIEQLLSILPFGLGNSKPVVAILRLEGVIGKVSSLKSGLSLCALNKLIEKMFKLDRLDAICLVINSPGGSPVQSDLIASRIISLAKENKIPVFSFIEDVAASGGYWIACAGDKIYANPSSIVGSIGVISSGFGFKDAIDKIGVERRIITEGKNKSVLDPFMPVKQNDVKLVKELQKNIYSHFTNTIKERRKGKLTQSDDVLFTGEFWTGQTALDYGLIDGIDDLYSFINKRYGNDVKIEYIENKQSWFKKKLGMALIAKEVADEVVNSLSDNLEMKILDNKFNFK